MIYLFLKKKIIILRKLDTYRALLHCGGEVMRLGIKNIMNLMLQICPPSYTTCTTSWWGSSCARIISSFAFI